MGSGSSAAAAKTSPANEKNKQTGSKDNEDDLKLSDYETDSIQSDDSDSEETKKSRKPRQKAFDEKREKLQSELKSIAKKMTKHPPDRIPNSESYQTSYSMYQKVLYAPNKESLTKVFEKELWALREHTASEIFSAEKSNAKTTREAILSEYKLKVCALVHCYKTMKNKIEEERMRLELEKLEDLKFLSKMQDRVENAGMSRSQLVKHMDDYGSEHRAKRNRLNDGSTVVSDGERTLFSRSSKYGTSAISRRNGYVTPGGVGMNFGDD